MCLIDKVAHQKESSEYARFPPTGDGGGADEQQQYYSRSSRNPQVNQAMMQQRNQGVMFLGSQSRASEMSTMVSVLSHVVSGQRAGDWGYGGNVAGEVSSAFGLSGPSPDSPSASGLWIGQKRGRDDETSSELVESAAPRVQRSSADFTGPHADSSSAATSGVYIYIPINKYQLSPIFFFFLNSSFLPLFPFGDNLGDSATVSFPYILLRKIT